MIRRLSILALCLLILGALGTAAWLAWRSQGTGRAGSGTVLHCPMHPEVTSDVPGSCPICGMELVSASRRGDDATVGWTAGRAASCDGCP